MHGSGRTGSRRRARRGARGRERRQVGKRAAARHHALGSLRQAQQLAQPVERHELDGRRPEPPPHDEAIALNPVASQSPSTPAYDDGPGTRAK